MSTIARILCPVDFSEFSRHAFDSAVTLARRHNAELTALYVVPPVQTTYPAIGVGAYVPYVYSVDDLRQFQKSLDQFVATAGYPVRAVCVEAPVVPEILRQAAEMSADLIVVGTHGRTGFDRLMLGSVAERVLAKATCPVLTIPPRSHEVRPVTDSLFAHVLCPIDFSPASLVALERAITLAEEGAALRVLHVVERLPEFQLVPAVGTGAPDDPLIVLQRARERVHNVIPAAARKKARVEEVISEGDAGDEIIAVAADGQADLIVMGAHARGAGLLGFGSTTNHVVRGAACPVLTLKA
jgi:nucleotide-binding universal stress UspA family protein